MINPAMFQGVDPEQIKKVQEVTRNIKSEVRVDKKEGKITLSLSTDNPDAAEAIPKMLEQFASGLCQQMYILFAISSEWVDVQ